MFDMVMPYLREGINEVLIINKVGSVAEMLGDLTFTILTCQGKMFNPLANI